MELFPFFLITLIYILFYGSVLLFTYICSCFLNLLPCLLSIHSFLFSTFSFLLYLFQFSLINHTLSTAMFLLCILIDYKCYMLFLFTIFVNRERNGAVFGLHLSSLLKSGLRFCFYTHLELL